MDRFGQTGKVSKKTGPPFEVDHFSRLDRSEFWLNGSRPHFHCFAQIKHNSEEEASEGAHMNNHIVVLAQKCDEFNNFEGF